MLALASVSMGEALAVLPPESVEEDKASAAYQLTVQVEAVERIEHSTTGGLDSGRAVGLVVEVTRAPDDASARTLGPGERIAFRVPVWAWSDRDREPPGPNRLYWGADAPPVRLEVWGSFQGGELAVDVFEAQSPSVARESSGPAVALARIDQITAAFVAASAIEDLGPAIERIAGLRLERAAAESNDLRATARGEDGWALGADLRLAGTSRLLNVSFGDSTCVRRADVAAHYDIAPQPIPASPHRTLPAAWHLEYEHPWGSIRFGFRMAQPHDYDDCLIEVLWRRDD